MKGNRFIRKSVLTAVALAAGIGFTSSAWAGVKVAIANFGTHPVLDKVVENVKKGIRENGYADATFEVLHVNFKGELVPQMLEKLAAGKPDIIVTVTTPVSQTAKTVLADKGIPIIFTAITDPVDAGLIPAPDKGSSTMNGVSDKQNMDSVVAFIKQVFPKVKAVGVPYNPGEPNDIVQYNEFSTAAKKAGLAVTGVGIDNESNLPTRIVSFRGKVDVVYIPASNLLQSNIGAVSAMMRQINMPAVDSMFENVEKGDSALAFAIDYSLIGYRAGEMAAKVLGGAKLESLKPYWPKDADHRAIFSKKQMAGYGVAIPDVYKACCVVD